MDRKLFGSIVKKAIRIEKVQTPKASQTVRGKTAVVVRQDKQYLENNKFAAKFYDDLGAYLRGKGYAVSFHNTDAGDPPAADLWINHGGYNPPKDTKQVLLPQYRRPFFTKGMRQLVDKGIQ